jgi:hypothetical protein
MGTPDLRAAWHEALAALGTVDHPAVRGMPDGTLLHLRDTYPTETAWAPPWTGDQLRQARTGAWEARLAATRATAEAMAARHHGHRNEAARQRNLAASYHAMHEAYQQRDTVLAASMDDRTAWEKATRQQRQLAIAADTELRRRHPDQPHPPLRSAEPQPSTPAQHDEPALNPSDDIKQTKELIEELTTQRREFARQYAERARQRQSPAGRDHENQDAWTSATRDAILQPPKPRVEPSARILERVIGRDLDLEAAD